MLYRVGLVLSLFVSSATGRALEAPEQLLSARTQVYIRWDGLKAHRASFDKTAFGKMMKGDSGKFVDAIVKVVKDALVSNLSVDGLLRGAPPEVVQKIQADVAQATKLLDVLSQDGFILAVDVRGFLPPSIQATLIVPNVGKRGEPVFAAARLFARAADAAVKDEKIEGRTVASVDTGDVRIAWWTEGEHAVVLLTTETTAAAVKRMTTGNDARLPSKPLFKRVQEFKEFETSCRIFVDFDNLMKTTAVLNKEAKAIIEGLGLDGLRSIVYCRGYEGEASRSVLQLDTPNGRRGLLSLLNGKPFKLEDLPPLPPDVVSWSMTSIDVGNLYDVAVKTIETLVHVLSPDVLQEVKDFLKKVDDTLGIDLRKDLLGSFGDKVVLYSSPSEGVFSLSQTILIKLKDPEKVLASMDRAIRGLGKATDARLSVHKRMYRGVEIREIRVKTQGFIFAPSYAVYKDWLVIGFYPQAVQGFILRASGELPVWKPDETVRQALAKLPKDFVSVSVSDPRPTVRQLLALGPLVAAAINSFVPESKFEVSSIPNAHEVCQHLFPNVAVTTDDGKMLRIDSRTSLWLPFELGGADIYLVVLAGLGFTFGL